MSERIDAHHHLWHYDRKEYGWISEQMNALARDFLPTDLEREIQTCGVDGTIVVQARQSLEETHWLLENARESKSIRGLVGWAPLANPEFPAILETLRGEPRLKGLRHVIQEEPDPEFMSGKAFNEGIGRLAGARLVYDILIYEKQLPEAIRLVDRHSNQVFVLDHIAKPRIGEGILEPWRRNVEELARRGNVYCKLSGMVTEADWSNWSVDDLRPYFDVVLAAFGPDRLMVGSDWPVCLLATSYQGWFATVGELIAPLSAAEQALMLGAVATKVYSLSTEVRTGKP